MEEAAQVWKRLLELGLRFEPKTAFPYLDALIEHRQIDQLVAAWQELLQWSSGEARRRRLGQDLITNGDFQDEIINGGLDWRVIPTEGVVVTVDSLTRLEEGRSLRIQFDGKNNLDYRHVYQYVPVKPNAEYRFTGYMRTQGITSDSGPRFQLVDAYDSARLFLETNNLIGTVNWTPQQLQLRTGPETRFLVLRVVRPPSRKFDNRLGGMLWVGHCALSAVK